MGPGQAEKWGKSILGRGRMFGQHAGEEDQGTPEDRTGRNLGPFPLRPNIGSLGIIIQ